MIDKKFNSDYSHNSQFKNDEFPKMYDDLDGEKLTELITNNPFLINKANDINGSTLLIRAVINGNYNNTEILLENGANPNLQNCYGETSLHQAVENRNHKIINLLLDKEANPNIQQKDGETPMHIACVKGDYKIVKLMLHYGANPRVKTFNEMTALDYAIELEKLKCVEVLQPLLENDGPTYSKQKLQNMSILSSGSNMGPIGGFNQGFRTMKNSNSTTTDFPTSNMYQNVNNTSKHSNMNTSINKIKGFNNNNFNSINNLSNISINQGNNYLSNNINNNNNFENEDRKQLNHQYSEHNLKKQNYLMNMNHTNKIDNETFQGDEDKPTLMNTKYFEDKFQKMKLDIMQISNNQDLKTNYNSNITKDNNLNNISHNNSIIKDQLNQNSYHTNYKNKLTTNNSNTNLKFQHKKSNSIANDGFKDLAYHSNNNGLLHNQNNQGSMSNLNNINNISAIKTNMHKQTLSNNNLINMGGLGLGGLKRNNYNSNSNLLGNNTGYTGNTGTKTNKSSQSNYKKGSNQAGQGSGQYDFNIEDNRVVTLKPEEFLDTYEKFDSKDDSRMISPGNIMNDDNFVCFNTNRTIKTRPGASVVNDNKFFGENYKSNYNRIYENFVDYNNVLALFVSSKNDVDYEYKDHNNPNISELNFNYNEIYEQQLPYNPKAGSDDMLFRDAPVSEHEDSGEILNLSDNEQNFNTSKKSIKYFSKSNVSIKDEYKQIKLDTQTIMNNHTVTNGKRVIIILIISLIYIKILKEIEMTEDKNTFEAKHSKDIGLIVEDDEDNEDYSEIAKEIYNFLKIIDLEHLTCHLFNNGFDDLSLMVDQMKSSSPITHENLKNIGILQAGQRAKILMKLEEGKLHYINNTCTYS